MVLLLFILVFLVELYKTTLFGEVLKHTYLTCQNSLSCCMSSSNLYYMELSHCSDGECVSIALITTCWWLLEFSLFNSWGEIFTILLWVKHNFWQVFLNVFAVFSTKVICILTRIFIYLKLYLILVKTAKMKSCMLADFVCVYNRLMKWWLIWKFLL